MRKVIADRLVQSKLDAPHFYQGIECQIDSLLLFRAEINNDLDPDLKISVNDFIIKACGICLMKVPEVNASWEKEKRSIILTLIYQLLLPLTVVW